jgi:thiamine biosynthesis lipoprotein
MTTPTPETNRREFLSGRSLVRALQHATPAGTPAAPTQPPPADSSAETYLVQVGRSAMACDFDILLNAGQYPRGTDAAVAALDLVDQLEAQLTVYRASSEIQSINRLAAQRPVAVEERLFRLLQRAVELHESTRGAFDITSGPLSRAWGFFRRAGEFPTADAVARARAQVGCQWLELDPPTSSVRFRRPGLEINLNAIGKGYALDRCSELLAERGVHDYLIHGGQSSILARGCRAGGPSHGRGWLVSVRHPYRPHERLAEIWLHDRALGTSGPGNQFFHFQGKRYGHVIDPRTGWPADQLLSATVLAPAAATADALSTALFVLGVPESLDYCASRPELAALLVTAGERAGEVVLHALGLQRDQWRAYA